MSENTKRLTRRSELEYFFSFTLLQIPSYPFLLIMKVDSYRYLPMSKMSSSKIFSFFRLNTFLLMTSNCYRPCETFRYEVSERGSFTGHVSEGLFWKTQNFNLFINIRFGRFRFNWPIWTEISTRNELNVRDSSVWKLKKRWVSKCFFSVK